MLVGKNWGESQMIRIKVYEMNETYFLNKATKKSPHPVRYQKILLTNVFFIPIQNDSCLWHY